MEARRLPRRYAPRNDNEKGLAMTMRGLNEVEKNYLAQISDNEEMVSPMPTSVFGFFTKIVGTAIKSYPL